MNGNIFKDYDTEKCSYHIFQPRQSFHFSDVEAALISRGFPVRVVGDDTTVALRDTVDQIFDDINQLMDLSDVGIMSGDILKAYGTDGIYKMEDYTNGDRIEPIHDEDILMQISNARYFPAPIKDENANCFSIRQLARDGTAIAHLYQARENLGFGLPMDSLVHVLPCMETTIPAFPTQIAPTYEITPN